MQKAVLTKEKSNIVYGIAACLMVFHHLFGFPERVPDTYIPMLDFGALHMETMLAYFGKICISLYAFISGYGLSQKAQQKSNAFHMIINQLKKFYIHYWTVFVIFVPYGMIKQIYSVNCFELFGNWIGWLCSYNAEWWYVKEYITMLFLFPFIDVVYEYLKKTIKAKLRIPIGIIVTCMVSITNGSFKYIMIFVLGIIFSQESIFEYIDHKIQKKYLWACICVMLVLVGRTMIGGSGHLDIILCPILIYGICILTEAELVRKYINPMIKILGKYSMYIWLTHTFFAYYYFQELVFMAKYSLGIFVWTIVLCLCVAVVIEFIQSKVFVKRINEER